MHMNPAPNLPSFVTSWLLARFLTLCPPPPPPSPPSCQLFADVCPRTAENFRQFCTGEFRSASLAPLLPSWLSSDACPQKESTAARVQGHCVPQGYQRLHDSGRGFYEGGWHRMSGPCSSPPPPSCHSAGLLFPRALPPGYFPCFPPPPSFWRATIRTSPPLTPSVPQRSFPITPPLLGTSRRPNPHVFRASTARSLTTKTST